jgi:signal transduction histidine kinase
MAAGGRIRGPGEVSPRPTTRLLRESEKWDGPTNASGSSMNNSAATQAMSDSLRSLDEIRYALDQAGIVAATDHRGIITRAVPAFLIPISGDDLKASADPDMLRAALLNITLNACQAAGTHEIDVHIAAENGHCRIAVCDRGPGIPAEVRERVFEPFFTTRTNGTGLGLAIVKRMMELQEGTVTLKDRPEGGTIAEVTVPRA